MGKVPVIQPRNRKHSDAIQRQGRANSDGTPAYPEHEQTPKMENHIGNESPPIKLLFRGFNPDRMIIRVPPLMEKSENSLTK